MPPAKGRPSDFNRSCLVTRGRIFRVGRVHARDSWAPPPPLFYQASLYSSYHVESRTASSTNFSRASSLAHASQTVTCVVSSDVVSQSAAAAPAGHSQSCAASVFNVAMGGT